MVSGANAPASLLDCACGGLDFAALGVIAISCVLRTDILKG